MSQPASRLDLDYSLDDKYRRDSGRIYLSGIQALVRLPMLQRQRDLAAGLNTAGFISGYRGSPLGGLDLNLWRARQYLEQHHIHFVPGLNEDLAATAVWGTQQVNLWPGAKYDGVFSMWYGKGPGVDRCGDVFKHANAAGTSRYGGVLVMAGDDHACRSSTLPHQSEHEFISAIMPILNPAGVHDLLELGLYGWALSRFTGRWVGFKTIAENVESSVSLEFDPLALEIVYPEDFQMPEGGLNIRWPDSPLEQEERLHRYALFAARAFARANPINRTVITSPRPRLGILTTGKSYLDVLQALDYLGIDHAMAADLGITVHKLGMTWPLEPESLRAFAEDLEDLIVVEEKRSFVERQLKELMYNWKRRPSVIGKYDEEGNWVLPSIHELTPAMIARVIARRLARFYTSEHIEMRLAFLERKEQQLARPKTDFRRAPHFCSGCPHNTSTQVPEGSRALAGIGCHYMTVWMDRRTETFTQMGGEGLPWVGQAPFTETRHVFVNLGDGTYYHSGSLAIRACLAAGVNITFKILYNDAVAMTGGQPVDGKLSVPDIARQVHAEGVRKIVVVSDEPEKWSRPELFPPGVSFHHRRELDEVQRQLREYEGLSVLIYDQTCAAEKRRRRKRGKMEDPARRVWIHPEVCEGCGDCGEQSNCLSITPLETPLGRKRRIDQSSCNKDFKCLDGFCPSFVTVEGGSLRRGSGARSGPDLTGVPEPDRPGIERPYSILLTGVGGTGVVTIAALLGMAAHLEGYGVTVLDQTGLAQKGGAVTSHIRIAKDSAQLHAVRIAAGEADLVLGFDLVVSAEAEALAKMRERKTRVVINTEETMPGAFTRQPDLEFPRRALVETLKEAVGRPAMDLVDASRLATALMTDSIATNLFMVGYAWQKGLVPVSEAALMRAIELNGVAVEFNQAAFRWGRLAAARPEQVEQVVAGLHQDEDEHWPQGLDQWLEYYSQRLEQWQDGAWARSYLQDIQALRERVASWPGGDALVQTAAAQLYRLMSYKDEYEVARLFAQPAFRKRLEETFEGDYRLRFHLAPPLWSKPGPDGRPEKKTFGPWMERAFSLLARLRWLRKTPFDPFGRTRERRQERALIRQYRQQLHWMAAHLAEHQVQQAQALLALPARIRGYGPVKQAAMDRIVPQMEDGFLLLRQGEGVDRAA